MAFPNNVDLLVPAGLFLGLKKEKVPYCLFEKHSYCWFEKLGYCVIEKTRYRGLENLPTVR